MDKSWVGRYSSANTRRSGSAKAVDVYSIRGVWTTRPQPHVSLTRSRWPTASTRTPSQIPPVVRISPALHFRSLALDAGGSRSSVPAARGPRADPHHGRRGHSSEFPRQRERDSGSEAQG